MRASRTSRWTRSPRRPRDGLTVYNQFDRGGIAEGRVRRHRAEGWLFGIIDAMEMPDPARAGPAGRDLPAVFGIAILRSGGCTKRMATDPEIFATAVIGAERAAGEKRSPP